MTLYSEYREYKQDKKVFDNARGSRYCTILSAPFGSIRRMSAWSLWYYSRWIDCKSVRRPLVL